jgi:predicted nucleotidyltransferase
VSALYLFGSFATNAALPGSDIDVFVDPVSDESFDFLHYMEAYEAIRRSVGEDIDVGYSTRDGLSPYIRGNVEREAIRIFQWQRPKARTFGFCTLGMKLME